MKRIDFLIVRGYIIRFVLILLIVFGLYVSFDAVNRLDHIKSESFREAVPRILTYYGYDFPNRATEGIDILLLVAAGLLLVQMSRRGELLTLKASGISLRRVALPVFLCTLPIVTIAFWAKEKVVPMTYRKQAILDRQMEKKVTGPFLLNDETFDYKLYVDSYDFARQRMKGVTLMAFSESGVIKLRIVSESGLWVRTDAEARGNAKTKANVVSLERVNIEHFDSNGEPEGQPEVRPVKRLKTSLTPFAFVRARQSAMSTRIPTMTFTQLVDHIQTEPNNPRFKLLLHSRIAGHASPFVLLLIGIPLLIGFEHTLQSRVLGAIVCIAVAGTYHVLSFVLASMGNTGLVPPVISAWCVPGLATAIGGWMFASMRT
ncbi:MAG: LptF/LptG family permease [Candidatus Brocadiia bacterium]